MSHERKNAPAPTTEGVVHMVGVGDVGYHQSHFAGAKGRSAAAEGFEDDRSRAFPGTNARDYDVYYTVHVSGVGDTPVAKNGEYCGIAAASADAVSPKADKDGDAVPVVTATPRMIEGFRVWVERFTVPIIEGVVHLSGIGDVAFAGSEYAGQRSGPTGTKGQSRVVPGFELRLEPAVSNLGIEYACHTAAVGDTAWQPSGFLGSRLAALRGTAAPLYGVQYSAHVRGKGDVPAVGDGAYVGTKGEGRTIEGIHVWVTRR